MAAASRNITAGSVVVYRWRYEGGAASLSSFSDGTAATWTTLEYGTNPTVGYAVCLNHPGGTGTVGTVNLSSGRTDWFVYGIELTGGSASIDAAPAGTNGANPTLTYSATGTGTGFAVTGYFSASTTAPTSPAALETTAHSYSGYWKNDHTGSGSKSMATTGGNGNTVSLVVVIKDAASAAPVITGPTATGSTLTGSGTVSTDTGSGTLWWKVDTSATATDPGSGSESGAGWTSQSVSATGTQTVSSFSTLTSGTKYAHYLHVATGGRSGVANSSAFTVGSGVTFSGTVPAQSGITATSFSLALAPYFSGNMTRTYAVQSGSLSGSGLTLNTSTGVISGTLATVAVYTVTIRATDTYSDTDDTNSFTITVSASGTAPTVSSNPSNTTVTAGATASFSAAASGSPTPTVQWQENTGSWTNISGQTSTTLSLGVVGTIDSGRVFRAVFTNSSGSATTTSATLTVNAASGDGTITSEPLKRNNGQLLGANTLSWLGFRNASTGADVLVMTSVTVNSSSIFTTGANAALAPGQLYAINWKTATGEYGCAWANAV